MRDSHTIPNTTRHLHPEAWGPIIVAVIVICIWIRLFVRFASVVVYIRISSLIFYVLYFKLNFVHILAVPSYISFSYSPL